MTEEMARARPRPFDRRVVWMTAGAALLLLLVVASKGRNDRLQDWGVIYWWLDYSDGMIRRGLVGQILKPLVGGLSQAGLVPPVMTINYLCIAILAGVMAGLTALTAGRLGLRDRLGFLALAVWLFVAQLWPTLAFNIGYLDTIVLLTALGAALAVRRRLWIPAALLVIAGPFVHEYFLFLVPFVVAAGLDDSPRSGPVEILPLDHPRAPLSRWLPYAIGVLGVVSALTVITLSHPKAAFAQLAPMPLDPELKAVLLRTTLSQGVEESVRGMLNRFADEIPYAIANFAFFLTPALVACAGLLFWRAPASNRTPWLQAAAALFPVTALLMAWDLSRLLVLTTFPAGMLFLLAAERRTRSGGDPVSGQDGGVNWRSLRTWGLSASILLAGAYAVYPFTYTYFGDRPTFRYFPAVPDAIRVRLERRPFALWLEGPWGHRHQAFEAVDVTCDLMPAAPSGGCARPVRSGEIIYGPYKELPIGKFRARFQFRAPPECQNNIQVDVFDVKTRGLPLVSTVFRSGGRVDVDLDFLVEDDMARRAPFEFRTLQSEGPACAVLEKVVVSRLSP